mmetsp:Transcript_18338/g.51961  ORF Transcript_18338/g.51961 Transcript_18338/m.51961 type:complete len:473 (+) Transcript_18338:127-1545(+)
MLSAQSEGAVKVGIHDTNLNALYRSVVQEQTRCFEEKGERYYRQLWATVAPKGNIYRRNALYAEHRKHSDDLWGQMREIADKYPHLLPGADTEARADRLHAELTKMRPRGAAEDAEGGAAARPTGFMPLEEFLQIKVWRFAGFYFVSDWGKLSEEVKHGLLAICVFMLQGPATVCIFLNRWNMKTNYLLHGHIRGAGDLFCVGLNAEHVLTILTGVFLLVIVIFTARCYVDEQYDNSCKLGRLPADEMWSTLGVIANLVAVSFVVLDIPLLFWSEETVTNIVLDSMTLIFLFKLDDLCEIFCAYLGLSDEDFQRMAAWSAALLSHCPVDLQKLINPEAKSAGELWSFSLDEEDNLQGHDGFPCSTRLSNSASLTSTERTRLVSPRTSLIGRLKPSAQELVIGDPTQAKLVYRITIHHEQELPTVTTKVKRAVWYAASILMRILNVGIPVMWYMINETCYEETSRRFKGYWNH